MSVELILYPLRGPSVLNNTKVLCFDRLGFDQDYRIFGQLKDISGGKDNKPVIQPKPIPVQMWVQMYEDEGIDETREDRYGDELTFVYAQQLKKLEVPEDADPKNKAIKAFIDELPNDTPIILQWR